MAVARVEKRSRRAVKAEKDNETRSGLRTERLGARATEKQKELIQRAAELSGRTVTDFMLSSALDKAVDVIRGFEVIELSERDARAFYEALENPPRMHEKIYEAMRWNRENVEMR